MFVQCIMHDCASNSVNICSVGSAVCTIRRGISESMHIYTHRCIDIVLSKPCICIDIFQYVDRRVNEEIKGEYI